MNRRKSNWNLVCNAGIGMGALAIAEEYPELAEEILRSSVRSIKNSIVGFAPDGGWEEGLGYWSYSIDYLVGYLGSLETALGTDFGLGDTPGLAEAGDFPIYLTGPTKEAFNFGDNGKGIFRRPEFFWLAQRYDKPEYDWWLRHVAGVSSHPRNFLWGLSGSDQRPDHEYPAPDRYFRDAEVVSLRSAWNDERACFVGFKGGANPGGHGDLDMGSFVFDALGVRWVEELGKDDYNLDGYFAYGPGEALGLPRAAEDKHPAINPSAAPTEQPFCSHYLLRQGGRSVGRRIGGLHLIATPGEWPFDNRQPLIKTKQAKSCGCLVVMLSGGIVKTAEAPF